MCVRDAYRFLSDVTKPCGTTSVIEENVYNGLNQRIGWHYDVDADGDVDSSDPWYWFVQDLRWRTVATYRVPTSWATAADSDPKERFIFHHAGLAGSGGSGYIDEVILRDRDNTSGFTASSDGTLEERFFHLHNWRHDVIALGKPDGTLVERVKYSAYGVATRLDPADYNQDGFIDFFDDDGFDADHTAGGGKADFDYNGTVNATDSTLWTTAYLAGGITARGALSTTNATTGTNNRAGYAGYTHSPATQQYHVRHRAYDPLVGTWGERDPMEYVDGSSLYMYVMSMPTTGIDPMGLSCLGMSCPDIPKLQPSGPSYDYPLDSGIPFDGLWTTPLRIRTPPRTNPGSTGPDGPTSPGGAPGFFTELQGSGGADCFIGPVKMSIKVERSQGTCICKSYDGSICVRPYERTRVCVELGLGVGVGCKYKFSGNIAAEPVGECPQGGGEPPDDFDLCLKCSVGGIIGSAECKACVKIPSGRTTFSCSLKASMGGASGGCSISAASCYTWVKYTGNENCGCVHEI
jgi:RHS repeat-associated protein